MNGPWRWRLFLADLDPVVGSEQSGRRPVLVVSDEDYSEVMPVVSVLPITSRKAGRRVYPNEVLLKRGTAGLTKDSIVLVHQVRTISKKRLVHVLGAIDSELQRRQILEALTSHLGLP